MKKLQRLAVAAIAIAPLTVASADDLSGARQLLCASVQATVCEASAASCESAPPWTWNIPQFIEIDLADKMLRTTEASGERRQTPIKNTQRSDGLIVLQGFEMGRAFSFVIEEATGIASVAVARDGLTVSVFGACTVNNK